MTSVLGEIAILAAVGILAAALLGRLRVPAAAGFLLAGLVVGPDALGLVRDREAIEAFAEVGIVLLLFTIGLEFSTARLARILRHLAVGGALQVGLTTLAVTLVALVAGASFAKGLFLGFVVAVSSTAVVLRALQERDELDAPHGRFIVGVLIFQDLCVVPMVLVLPVLAGRAERAWPIALAWALVKAVALVALTFLVARRILPWLLRQLDKVKSREVFLLFVVACCAGTAWLTSIAGLSLALGAFLAGMMLAESDEAHRAMTETLPLRDLFTSFFFLSIGMLFDPTVVADQPLLVVLLTLTIFVGKALIATLACLAMRFPPSVAVVAGVGLSALGEFGFVLARMGEDVGLVGKEETSLVLACGVISMILAPLVARLGPHIAAGASRLSRLERLLGARGVDELAARKERLSQHVVIVGYGIAGELLARALRESGIRRIVLDISAEIVRKARAARVDAYLADVTSEEAMKHARVEHARALVLLMNDPWAIDRAIAAARRLAPGTPIFARTRYLRNVPRIAAQGVTEVVAEEVEGAVEILARVLREFDTPRNVLADRVREAREVTQSSAREMKVPRKHLGEMAELQHLKVESFLVREGCHAVGQSAVSLKLHSLTRALVVAGRRAGQLLANPRPNDTFEVGDVVYLVGDGEALSAAMELLETGHVHVSEVKARKPVHPMRTTSPETPGEA